MTDYQQRNLRHFYFRDKGTKRHFVSPRSGGGEQKLPERDRDAHAQQIEEALTHAVKAAERQFATHRW